MLWNWIMRWFFRPAKPAGCTHARHDGPARLTVLGHDLDFPSLPCCARCAERYLNRFSVLCCHCGKPIVPGEPVGYGALKGSVTHNTMECTPVGNGFAGRWGAGKLEPREE